MRVFLDANYIVYLKYSESDEVFEYCINLFKKLKKFEKLTNVVVINEVVWILRKKYKVELNEIFDFLDKLLDHVKLVPLETEDYELMKKFVLEYNLKPSDALHVSSMEKSGTRLIVFENPDFDRLNG